MITQLFLTALFVAGIAVCWRNLQNDIASFYRFLKSLPYILRKSLMCGFCFTYWAAFMTTLLSNPLSGVSEKFKLILPETYFLFSDFFFGWVSLGMAAVIIRFAYVVLQELVHYQVHILKNTDHKH